MNVAISDIATDLGTTVSGVQLAITAVHADDGGPDDPRQQADGHLGPQGLLHARPDGLRSRARSSRLRRPASACLIVGYSLLEGIGTALLIPPVYILATVFFADVTSRARAFGAISAAGGIGAAAGPLIGGLITSDDQLARVVRRAGARGRRDHRPGPPDRRPGRAGAEAALRPRSAPSCRRPGCSSSWSASCRPGPMAGSRPRRTSSIGDTVVIPAGRHLAGLAVRPDRRAAAGVVLLAHPVDGARRQGAAAVDEDVPEPRGQPRPGDAERSSGWCCSACRSWCRSSCRPCGATARSRPA